MKLAIDLILVPRGAEYQAVCRGLEQAGAKVPEVLSIPLGRNPVINYLKGRNWQKKYSRVLLMGVCGSLSPDYAVGNALLIRECSYGGEIRKCDRNLSDTLYHHFQGDIPLVRGVTSEFLICSAKEKAELGRKTTAQAIDMEGIAVLDAFPQVAMLRVVSDEWDQVLPNLNCAISSTGSLQPLSLTLAFLRQPLAAMNLIRSSLQAIKKLELIAVQLGLGLKSPD
jgi:hypothetical protein